MDGYRRCLRLLVAMGLFALGGAGCQNLTAFLAGPPPRVLPPSPTLEQVIQVVNQNSQQVHSLSTTHATLSGPGIPSLRANIAFERPGRFRLRADTAVTGPEVDLGSNDELFWFWCKRNDPPAVFYCRHDQFATSRARQQIPIDPNWLVEAIGVSGFDPCLPHQGPFALPGDRLEVRTIRDTPEGPAVKSTVLDGASGWVLEQHAYDPQGQLVASSFLSRHQRDPLTNVVLPRVVKLSYPAAGLSLRLDLGGVQVNQLPTNQIGLWSIPQYPGAPPVDLCSPGFQVSQPVMPLAATPGGVPDPGRW